MAASSGEQLLSDGVKDDFNVLLLGETGVGKSTFINAFVNYLKHTTFNNARKSELSCLIPLKFVIPNEFYEEQLVQFGYEENEDTLIGNSSTQETKAYVFPFENHNIRLIDTPGIGDARGLNQDKLNFENVLDHISQYEKLHAICFLLKPNVSVINAYFKFCIMHLVSRLDRSAVDNMIFIFTNSRNTFYRPGETLPVLKRILQEIEDGGVHVPLSKKNMFCIDNEAFKFLIAMRCGIRFDKYEIDEFRKSWRISYKTCRDLMGYICGGDGNESIAPHNVHSTVSINKTLKDILNFMRTIADTVDYVLDNITILSKHLDGLEDEKKTTTEINSMLYKPMIAHRMIELKYPITMCTSSKCSVIREVGNVKKWEDKVCHNNCILKDIEVGVVGSSALLLCVVFSGSTCKECGCHYSKHVHRFYESERVESVQNHQPVNETINNNREAIEAAKKLSDDLKQLRAAYIKELESVTTCMAKSFVFLSNNSISSCNDVYLEYLTNIIEREASLPCANNLRLLFYKKLQKSYLNMKEKMIDEKEIVTADDVQNLIKSLYDQRLIGSQISLFHATQTDCIAKTFNNQEYKYPTLMKAFVDVDSSSDEDDDWNDDKMDASTVYCPNKHKSLLPVEATTTDGSKEMHIPNERRVFIDYATTSKNAAENKDSTMNLLDYGEIEEQNICDDNNCLEPEQLHVNHNIRRFPLYQNTHNLSFQKEIYVADEGANLNNNEARLIQNKMQSKIEPAIEQRIVFVNKTDSFLPIKNQNLEPMDYRRALLTKIKPGINTQMQQPYKWEESNKQMPQTKKLTQVEAIKQSTQNIKPRNKNERITNQKYAANSTGSIKKQINAKYEPTAKSSKQRHNNDERKGEETTKPNSSKMKKIVDYMKSYL